MLVFVEEGKPENPEKNRRSNAKTNGKLSPHNYGTWLESKPGHNGASVPHHCIIPAFLSVSFYVLYLDATVLLVLISKIKLIVNSFTNLHSNRFAGIVQKKARHVYGRSKETRKPAKK